jgi:hypothetical protein
MPFSPVDEGAAVCWSFCFAGIRGLLLLLYFVSSENFPRQFSRLPFGDARKEAGALSAEERSRQRKRTSARSTSGRGQHFKGTFRGTFKGTLIRHAGSIFNAD